MQNSYNVNFQGGFLIKTPKPETWNKIKTYLPKRKAVFEEFNKDGDKFFATKTCYDKELAYKLLKEKVRYIFYPEINLNNRLDPRIPDDAKKVLDSEKNFIEVSSNERDGINKFFQQSDIIYKNVNLYRWVPEDHIDQTLKALNLNKEDCSIDIKKGVAIISDKNGNVIAKASPNSQYGFNYVHKLPQKSTMYSSDDTGSRLLVVNCKGEIVDRFQPHNYMAFCKEFIKNVRYDNIRRRPQKPNLG